MTEEEIKTLHCLVRLCAQLDHALDPEEIDRHPDLRAALKAADRHLLKVTRTESRNEAARAIWEADIEALYARMQEPAFAERAMKALEHPLEVELKRNQEEDE